MTAGAHVLASTLRRDWEGLNGRTEIRATEVLRGRHLDGMGEVLGGRRMDGEDGNRGLLERRWFAMRWNQFAEMG